MKAKAKTMVTGWRHPASKYSRLKAEIDLCDKSINRCKTRLAELPSEIEALERRKAQAQIVFDQESKKVHAEEADELQAAFLKLARQLDENFRSELLTEWRRLALVLHSPPFFRIIASYQQISLSISRITRTLNRSARDS